MICFSALLCDTAWKYDAVPAWSLWLLRQHRCLPNHIFCAMLHFWKECRSSWRILPSLWLESVCAYPEHISRYPDPGKDKRVSQHWGQLYWWPTYSSVLSSMCSGTRSPGSAGTRRAANGKILRTDLGSCVVLSLWQACFLLKVLMSLYTWYTNNNVSWYTNHTV